MQYQLRVLRFGQPPRKLNVEASSVVDARNQAEQQGLTVLQIKQHTTALGLKQGSKKSFPLMLFCQEFRSLFEAGLSVVDVLQTLIDKEISASAKQVLAQLLTAVQEGKTLSQAFSSQPIIFPHLFTATIAAAETTGDLPEALMRYQQYLENVDALKKRIINASVYPAIVVSFGLAVLVFLLLYVIPKFSKIYETQVSHVSTSTQILLSVGKFSQQYGWLLLVSLGFVFVAIFSILQRSQTQQMLSTLFCKIPFFGEKIRIYYLSRFYRTFAMLLKSGIPVMSSLAMVDSLLGAGLYANLQQAKASINQGQPLSQALSQASLTTPVALRLIHIGEKTGSLASMMARAASFHEDDMVRWIDHFTKVFEPTIMAIIGLMIGGIVLMMYLPIFELASGIQ